MKAVLLLSGGIDSTTILADLRDSVALCVGFDYGQPHLIELDRAAALAQEYDRPFERVSIPAMPRVNDVVFAGRNGVFLALGAAIAQQRGLEAVVIGCNWSDMQRFPDCRPAFLKPLSEALRAAYGVAVWSPLLHLTKRQVVLRAQELGVDLRKTLTCYAPYRDGTPCGECYACLSRAEAGA
jgi:7-cyano-7-deazaguanine synthase